MKPQPPSLAPAAPPVPLAPASAQAASAAQPAASSPGLPLIRDDGGAAYGSLVPALGMLLLAGVALVWLLRRSGWQRLKGLPLGGRERLLQVRETVHVSPKVRVTYLQCGGQELLLAHSDQSQAWVALPPRGAQEPGHGA
jgi:hypothetical protein